MEPGQWLNEEREKRTYLGDGLYAEDEGYRIRLYASNGIETTNEVFLDDHMLVTLMSWRKG